MKTHILQFREVDRDRFEEIRSGSKCIETRAASDTYKAIQTGDEIHFVCGLNCFSRRVIVTYHWNSIEELCSSVPIKKIMPGLSTIAQVRNRYATYPDYLEKIEKRGICGFELA